MAARYLLRDWFQIRSKMNCMLTGPVLLETRIPGVLFLDFFVGSGKRFRLDARLMTVYPDPGGMLPPQSAATGSTVARSVRLIAHEIEAGARPKA